MKEDDDRSLGSAGIDVADIEDACIDLLDVIERGGGDFSEVVTAMVS
jgi:hypothetical protein